MPKIPKPERLAILTRNEGWFGRAPKEFQDAALLAVTTFQQSEFAAFGALFLLFQAPVLIGALLLRKHMHDLPATGTRVH